METKPKRPTILLVEDDKGHIEILRDVFRGEGYDVITAMDGQAGYRLAGERSPDLLVLDLLLPGMSGLEICGKLRAQGIQTPILMLTALGSREDVVTGLRAKADDYVCKPFNPTELVLRIGNLLRRQRAPLDKVPIKVRIGDVDFDFGKWEGRRNGILVPLRPKEFGIVRLLVARVGEVVTNEEILASVFDVSPGNTTRTIDTHFGEIRRKLGKEHFITVHGVGRKLTEYVVVP